MCIRDSFRSVSDTCIKCYYRDSFVNAFLKLSLIHISNDECFLSPDNMTEEVKDYCRRTGQKVPETLGEIATVIYTSLAECYAKTAKELEEMTGRTYSRIHIVGGGSNAGYLNELTAKATKKEIHAGPGEATAIGNITAQMPVSYTHLKGRSIHYTGTYHSSGIAAARGECNLSWLKI